MFQRERKSPGGGGEGWFQWELGKRSSGLAGCRLAEKSGLECHDGIQRPAGARKLREDSHLWMAPLKTTHRFC